MQKVLFIHDFMLADENLKGSKLLVYALVYSYSQIPNSQYLVNWRNACKFLGLSKSSYFDALKWLVENKYIGLDYSLDTDRHYTRFYDNCINRDKVSDLAELCKKVWSKIP